MSGLEITIVKQVGSIVARKFGQKVIERWTRYRANQFFEGFVTSISEELENGIQSTDVDEKLEKILDDGAKSEILFDAYRSVCFAKSKTLGPKIIGILTGQLIAEGRSSDGEEEYIFSAAEALSDTDLIDLRNEFRRWEKEIGSEGKDKPSWAGNSMVIPWHREVRDTAWPHTQETEFDVTQLNFSEVFGAWGGNAARVGLLASRLTQRQQAYREDSERHIDEDGTLTIYAWTVTFEAPCRKLCDLIDRSLGATAET